MREELVEVLVKCKKNVGLTVAMVISYALCAVAALFGLAMGSFISLIIAAILGFIGYLSGSKSLVEYEYTYCEKEIDIDIIYSQEKRKKLLTLDLNKMEALVKYDGTKMGEYKNRQLAVKDYSSKREENAAEVYALIYEGGTMYLIEPGERLLNALSYVCPRKIYKN